MVEGAEEDTEARTEGVACYVEDVEVAPILFGGEVLAVVGQWVGLSLGTEEGWWSIGESGKGW